MKGRLYIHFNVEFPESGVLSPEKCQALEKVLPLRRGRTLSNMEVDQCEETTLHDVNMGEESRQQHRHPQREAYVEDDDEDDDDELSMPRVQCAQQ